MSRLTFESLQQLTGGEIGIHDRPCPLCSDLHNPRRPVLRIWCDDGTFCRYNCVRCGDCGWAKPTAASAAVLRYSAQQIAAFRREAEVRRLGYEENQLAKVHRSWTTSIPIAGTEGEAYLRGARGYGGPLHSTLRFLPPTKPGHHPALLAAFGFPDEPEPGTLGSMSADMVRGVHLTLLAADGSGKDKSGKAGTDRDKFMVGSSTGTPIVLAPFTDSLGLIIAEGIEDALTMHQALGLGAWAAGCASRLSALADAVPDWTDAVTVVVDPDPAGRHHASKLIAALRRRGLNAEPFSLVVAPETAE